MEWKTTEILIIVKAYPTPSSKYGETVCTAGITKDGKWIRLYPISYRDLPRHQQYQKFQWIRANIAPASEKLRRPESYKIDAASIEVLDKVPHGTAGWRKREQHFLPLVSASLEELEEQKATKNVTLGAFKPEHVTGFIIREDDQTWTTKKLAAISQNTLFNTGKTPLEKIPYTFHYQFSCSDARCKHNHDLTIVDWEVAEGYRNFKLTYKDEELTKQMMRKKWLDYFFKLRESYFIVGTDSEWNRFMILTVVSPRRKEGQLTLGF